jgi:hypothetical protein
MSAGWVAGSVRARALAHRRMGPQATGQLASCGSLSDALRVLAVTGYGANIRPEQPLAVAQRQIADTVLWNLRVLAGWLPGDGVRMLRVLGAWFELANVDELLQSIAGRPAEAEFELGALGTAWQRLREAASIGELRAALAASTWQDPGGQTLHAMRLGLRARWAVRAAALDDPVRTWAAGAVALLVAGERFAAGRSVDQAVMSGALNLLGPDALRAGTLAELAEGLPPRARWVLAGITSPADLWRAEETWVTRVEQDGLRLLRTSSLDSGVVLGAVAVMACDAWRIRAALEIAAWGGTPPEASDELA